jgi:hypothetical protein
VRPHQTTHRYERMNTMATRTIDDRLGNCPRCGVQLTEVTFEPGIVDGPSENGWRTLERAPNQDRLTLTPCGCTFVGEDARRESTALRERMKRRFLRIRGWGMVPQSPVCTVLTLVDTEKGWYTTAPVETELLDSDPHAAETVYARFERWMRHNTASGWYDRLSDVVRP